ncbi:terminase small subunit [Microcoleus sp. herbarium7]|uniref:terminase small subunit n=1 Tax=Microcoleus sp. herbarium7 TaxID=3055435 RepID=UPI002FD5C2E1
MAEKTQKNTTTKLKTKKLSLQQQRFCEEYLFDGKAGLAYTRAGYQTNSRQGAESAGSRLLSNVNIQTEIDRLRKERGKETSIDSSRILTELGIIGLSNILDYIEYENGIYSVKPSSEWEHPQAVAEFSTTTFKGETKVSFKLHNKMDALQALAKHAGLLADINVALAVLKRYGYEVEETEEGLFCRDTYASDKIQIQQTPRAPEDIPDI